MAARNRDGGRKFVLISLALKRHHQLEEKKEDAVSRQEREGLTMCGEVNHRSKEEEYGRIPGVVRYR